jgi:hypothetical protein
VVFVDNVEFPPLERFGLPEFAAQQQLPFDGITFDDTYFLRKGAERESLHFHQLVHVVQWQHLGFDKFLFAYGVGLAQFGYEASPLEKMAYDLQSEFENRIYRQHLIENVQKHPDEIWGEVAELQKQVLSNIG